nr:potassium/sodium hyperpolarization-activated cyclic nucleotide-gated channel 2-like [Dasypus novemcinctus]
MRGPTFLLPQGLCRCSAGPAGELGADSACARLRRSSPPSPALPGAPSWRPQARPRAFRGGSRSPREAPREAPRRASARRNHLLCAALRTQRPAPSTPPSRDGAAPSRPPLAEARSRAGRECLKYTAFPSPSNPNARMNGAVLAKAGHVVGNTKCLHPDG